MPTGYDYVAAKQLFIDHILAFNVGQPVPNTTVTSQGWVVGLDVTVPGAVTPGIQTVLAAPQTLSSSEQQYVRDNIGVTAQLGTLVAKPSGSTAGFVATVGSDGNSIVYAAAGAGGYDGGTY